MITEFIVFLLGIHIMMVLLAAAYGFLDLWYRISDYWTGLAARLLSVLIIESALLWLLSESLLNAFVWGQACYLFLHLSKFFIARLLLYLIAPKY